MCIDHCLKKPPTQPPHELYSPALGTSAKPLNFYPNVSKAHWQALYPSCQSVIAPLERWLRGDGV